VLARLPHREDAAMETPATQDATERPSTESKPRVGETAEQALRHSEVRYRRLFESCKDGILILDADNGEIIDVNPYLAELLGYDHADFLGKQIWDFGPFKDIVASKEAFDELQTMDYVAYEDLPLQTRAGRHIDVGFVSNVYLVEEKRIIQCNIRDITDRKQAEKLADQLRAHLEEQLQAAQRMEAIGSLAGGIAHDFNNLLAIILCFNDFTLQSLPDGSEHREDLLEVDVASKRAALLVRQLLAFGSKRAAQPVALDLNAIAEGIERMLQRILRESIQVVQTLEPDLGLILADASQIEQVIMNLVVNARDAMPSGGKLTIETANVDVDPADTVLCASVKAGSYVMLAISDTGCGMDAATRSRIFEPFFTTKAPDKGTGLGLATVSGIVRQSGGTIAVFSEPGNGTTFKIYFPRELSMAVPPTAWAPDAVPPERTVSSETILVVEDEEAVRNLARRILSAAGYTVLTAVNGRDALLLCAAHTGNIPLVLTDVVMPQMGGRVFAAKLRQLRPMTKFLFTSGYSDDAIFHPGLLEGGDRFIGKPFSAAALALQVREMLDDKPPLLDDRGGDGVSAALAHAR
jgi:two-component system cell cycle sensor histidine kinase/response regulator CckA